MASGPVSRGTGPWSRRSPCGSVDADTGESGGTPEAPRVTLALDTSLTVAWDEPENPGPPITDYDVQYREGPSGFFINAPHEGTGQTATLRGLEAATLYQVQVRARNEEGTGRWSEPGEGWTLAGPTAHAAVFRPRRGRDFPHRPEHISGTPCRVWTGGDRCRDDPARRTGHIQFPGQNGILVSEAGVPAVPPPFLRDGSLPRPTGPVRTGLAMANPNDTARATIDLLLHQQRSVSTPDTIPSRWDPGNRSRDSWTRSPFNGGSAIVWNIDLHRRPPGRRHRATRVRQ